MLDEDEDARRLDFGEPVELVAREVDELDELLLLRDRDLQTKKQVSTIQKITVLTLNYPKQ